LKRFNEVKTYIDENNKRPSKHSKDKNIKFIGKWIGTSQTNYTKKHNNMKDENIYKLWTEFINDQKYKEYIQLPTMLENFYTNLNKLKNYIDINKKRPSEHHKDKYSKKLGMWIGHCQRYYATKTCNMKDDTIYKLWTEFINDEKYKEYMQLPTMLESFNINLNKIKTYIDINKKIPSQYISDNKIIKSMGFWINNQNKNYSKKIHNMANENIYKLWTEFINDAKYKTYFLSQYDKFVVELNKVKNYIDINNKRPSQHSKDKDVKFMAHWIGTRQKYYVKKEQNMKDENIYKLWTEFINDEKYKIYFN
jgi:hypothetical protein